MVFDSDSVTALGIERADFVFDFLEAAFDFPAGGVVFDHLFGGKRQVGSDQRKTKAFTVNEHHFDLTLQGLGHADEFGKSHVPFFAVEMDFCVAGLTSPLSGKFPDRSKPVTVLRTASALSADADWHIVQHGADPQAAEEMNRKTAVFSYLPEQRKSTEPTVADDQRGTLEAPDQPDNQFRADAGFGFEPLCVSELDFFPGCFGRRQVKLLDQRQTGPAAVDKEQQSGDNPAVSENIFGTIGLGGMVEVDRATGDMPAGLSECGVVKRQQQPAVNRRIADHERDKLVENFPRQLFGVDEIVETLERDVSGQKHGEPAKDAADPSGLAAGCQRDDESFENHPAVGGDEFGGLVDELIEFHVRLLGLN